jgi:hypothetical protein
MKQNAKDNDMKIIKINDISSSMYIFLMYSVYIYITHFKLNKKSMKKKKTY